MKTSLLHLFKVFLFCITFYLLQGNVLAQTQTKAAVPNGYKTRFWLYLPPSYSAGGAESPILISLHGGSGIGDSLEMLTHQLSDDGVSVPTLNGNNGHNSPSRLIYNLSNDVSGADKWNPSLPFVVVSPQLKRDASIANHNEQNWPPDQVDELVDYIIDTYNVNPSRVYITGISLGGTGSWNYAVAYPEKVAALMPLGGKTPKSDACLVKDIPIWAFHGDSDPLVPVRFSTDMLNAVEQCSPSGLYKMHLNTPVSMPHEIWNPIYTLRAGYDIYSWFLSFTKGDNSNHAPFVNVGVDRKVVDRPGPLYLTSEYFDSDGEVASVLWTQLSGSPGLTLASTNSRFLEITDPAPGTFVFRLTVTDNDGASRSDDVQIQILANNEVRTVTSIRLRKQEEVDREDTSNNLTTDFGAISDNAIYDLNLVAGPNSMINLEAVTTGSTQNVSRVKWSINSDQHTKDSSSPFYAKALSGSSAAWIVKKGTYLVCATPYSNSTFANEGTSLCHKITFTDEPSGLTKYYAKANADLSTLTSWGTQPDGSGSAPSSFTTSNQWFIVSGTANVTAGPLNIGTNRLIVQTTGQLTFSNLFTGSLYSEGLARISSTVNGALPASSLVSISRTSTTEFNGRDMNIPAGTYGNLVIKGAGLKTIPATVNSAFQTIVNGNLTIESGADVVNPVAGANHGISVSGNVTIGQVSSVPYVLQIIDGFGNQYVTLPGSCTFRDLIVAGGCTASIDAPGTSTITLGTGTGGKLEVHSYSLLKLNGHNLTLSNNASINPDSGNGIVRTGQIECDNSTITLTTTSTGNALNFYPATGKNNLKSLDVTIPANHAGFNVLTPLRVTEKLKITNGKINSNGNVTLVSTPTSTAYVASSTGSFGGNVKVERSIPKGTVYRYLTFPAVGATVAELQQHIPVNGNFPERTNSMTPSMFYYNEGSTGWIPYPTASAASSTFELGRGYTTYISDAVNSEHITMSGTLRVGNFPFGTILANNSTSANNKGWSLLGNPYAAPVNWDAPTSVASTWIGTGISSTVYVRANDGTSKILYNDGQIGTFNGNIASGQSFWVRTTGPGAALTVTEAAKFESTNVQLYRTQQTDAIYLHFNLSNNNLDDDAFLKFNSSGKIQFDTNRDAVKMKNDFFNLSLLSSDSVGTAIKNVCDTLCSQEITLAVEPKDPGTYSLTVEGPAFDELISGLAIADKFKNKVTEWKEGETFSFEVTNDPASSHPKRFTLLIDNNQSPRPAISFSEGSLFSSVTQNIQWLLNGVEIPGATAAEHVPSEEGEYSVSTTYKGCTKTSAGYAFRITGTNNPRTSEIRLHPNPTRENITITGIHAVASSVEYNITSLTGASVQSGLIDYADGNGGAIRLQSLAPGLYIVNIKNGTDRYQLKFSVR